MSDIVCTECFQTLKSKPYLLECPFGDLRYLYPRPYRFGERYTRVYRPHRYVYLDDWWKEQKTKI